MNDDEMFFEGDLENPTEPVKALNENIVELTKYESELFRFLGSLDTNDGTIYSAEFIFRRLEEFFKPENYSGKQKKMIEAIIGFYLAFYITAHRKFKGKVKNPFVNGFNALDFRKYINESIDEISDKKLDAEKNYGTLANMEKSDIFFSDFFDAIDHNERYSGLDVNPLDSVAFRYIDQARKMLSVAEKKKFNS